MTDTMQNDILTLHDSVRQRWSGETSIGTELGVRHQPLSRATDLLHNLAGLAALDGRFGSDSWDIASMLAMSPSLMLSAGPVARAMSLAELAEIVQIVIEEEETFEDDWSHDGRRADRRRQTSKPARRMSLDQKAKVAAVKRAVEQARKEASRRSARRRSADVARRVSEARATLETLRQQPNSATSDDVAVQIQAASIELARLEAEAEAESIDVMPGASSPLTASGDFMSDRVEEMGFVDPVPLGTRGLAAAIRSTPSRFGFVDGAPSEVVASPLGLQPRAVAGGVGWQRSGTRALQMADSAAELAMLQPGASEGPFEALAGIDAVQNVTRLARRAQRPEGFEAPLSRPSEIAPGFAQYVAQRRLPPGVSSRSLATAVASGRPAATHLARRVPALAAASLATAHQVRKARDTMQAIRPAQRTPGFTAAHEVGRASGQWDFGGLQSAALSTVSKHPVRDYFSNSLTGAFSSALTTFSENWLASVATRLGAGPSQPMATGMQTGAGVQLQLVDDFANDASDSSPVVGGRSPRSDRRQRAPRSAAASSTGSSAMTPAWLAPASAHSPTQLRAIADAMGLPLDTVKMWSADRVALDVEGNISPPRQQPLQAKPRAVALAQRVTEPLGRVGLQSQALGGDVSSRALTAIQPGVVAPSRGEIAAFDASTPTLWDPGRAGDGPATVGAFARGDVDTLAEAATAAFGGVLARDAGAGEWLLPGDEGYDDWAARMAQPGRQLPPHPAASVGLKQRELGRGTLPTAAVNAPSSQVLGANIARSSAAAQGADVAAPAGLVRDPVVASSATRFAPPVARAATAAVQRFIETRGRAVALGALREPSRTEHGALAFAAAAGGLDVLSLAPLGRADALTSWLFQHDAAGVGTGPSQFSFAGDGEFQQLDIGAEELAAGADGRVAVRAGATSTRAVANKPESAVRATSGSGTSIEAMRPAAIARQQDRLRRILSQPSVRAAAKQIGGGALDITQPAAMRAALAMYGESGTSASDADLGALFVQRFFGRGVTPPTLKSAGSAEMAQLKMPSLSSEAASETAETARSGAISATASRDDKAPKQLVVEGLAGLSALRALSRGETAERELRAVGATEQTLVKPAASDSASSQQGLRRDRAGKASRGRQRTASTAVKTHRFAPTALRRGRGLLGRSRRQQSKLLNVSPTTAGGRHRVGYGSAELGGGALVGLTGEGSYHGGDFGGSRLVGGAERLSDAVRARRGTRPGQVGRSMSPTSSRGVARSRSPHGLPTHFDINGDTTYVDTSSAPVSESMRYNPRQPASAATRRAVQQAAAATSATAGASATARASKAASVARVLSVTAAPTANVLPLVAPAARAVAAAAAAKPIAESISTSGASASQVAPLAGHGIDGATAGGSGRGSTPKERKETGGTSAEELDMLAVKIARSIMIRLKRERERRGLNG